MKDVLPPSLIEVQKLRVGMFIHLDVGWMAHPFPLSSFKISSADQIATIRGLGKASIRWSPDKSDLDPADATVTVVEAPAPAADARAETPQAAQARRHREALAVSRARLTLCERQFAEATRACRQVTELVPSQPERAGEQAEALGRTFVDKMLGDQEMCIRLLTDAAGDKASHHAVNVTVISLLMGRTFGLSEPEMMDLGVGSLMHDIG
jgi:HD-GYP domain-containing protein (c-di-GMP phosphodiesterase class II)